ncbi:MAG: sensor histidine kinase [Nitriliruptoraceae bacterium]
MALAVAAIAQRVLEGPGARLATATHGVALALALTTGALLLAHRRATGHALGPRLVIPIAALEASTVIALLLAASQVADPSASLQQGLVRSVLTVGAGLGLIRALRGPEIDLRGWATRMAPPALILAALAGAALSLPTGGIVAATAGGADHLAAALVWSLATLLGWHHLGPLRGPVVHASVCAAPLVAVAEIVRAAEALGHAVPAATAPMLVTAALALVFAGAVLGIVGNAVTQRSALHVRGTTARPHPGDAEAQRRSAHEVANALLAVEAACERLESSPELERAEQERLAAAIRDGVDHLRALLRREGPPGWDGPSLAGTRRPDGEHAVARVDEVARRAVRLAEARGLALDLDLEPVGAPIDPTALRQVIDNLLINVERHAGPDARGAATVRRAGDHVEVVIDDDGTGIPMTARNRVLRPGEKGDAAGPGEGLGLAVVADVLHEAGGSVDLSRSPAGGLRVTLRLPAAQAGSPGRDRADAGEDRLEVDELLGLGSGSRAQEAAAS